MTMTPFLCHVVRRQNPIFMSSERVAWRELAHRALRVISYIRMLTYVSRRQNDKKPPLLCRGLVNVMSFVLLRDGGKGAMASPPLHLHERITEQCQS